MSAPSRRAVVVDRWDRQRYLEAIGSIVEFAAEGRALADAVGDGGEELWADVFAAFDLVVPTLVPPHMLDPAVHLNREVLAAALQLPEYGRLKAWTEGDVVAAALAGVTLRPALQTIHDKALTVRRRADTLAATRAAFLSLVADGAPDEDIAALREQVVTEAAELALHETEAAGEMLSLRAALGRAAGDAERAGELSRMWSGGLDLRLPAEERLALARRFNNPRFAAMAEYFGAIEALMAAEERLRPSPVPDDVGDLEHGRDLSRVLPSALMQLVDGREDLFYADYLEGRLPQMGRTGTERLGRGGVVCCIDSSISTAGRPEQLAKAMALALLHLCRRQRRPFYGIIFSDDDQLREFDFTQPYGVDLVLAFAECYIAGGTDFVTPLRRARELLGAEFDSTGATQADIVFITDGQATVSNREKAAHLAEMDRIGASTWGILLGGARREPLATLCADRVVDVEDILDPAKDLRSIVAGLVRA